MRNSHEDQFNPNYDYREGIQTAEKKRHRRTINQRGCDLEGIMTQLILRSMRKSQQMEGERRMFWPQKFYLVGITGRTSFILQNLKGYKFKITIGNELKCSCNQGISKQCPHTLHALIEIFYIPEQSSMLSLNHYTDRQLRYIIASRRIHLNKIEDFLKNARRKVPKRNVILEESDQEDDDNLCAICQMQIVKCDAVTTCITECKNSFHLDCFSQWANHQMRAKGIVKCPLCNDQKPQTVLCDIKLMKYEHREQVYNKKVGMEFNYYCDGCQLSEIQGNEAVFKCLECEDVTLCENCFKLGKHIRHSFISKGGRDKKWRECEDRKNKKKIDSEAGLIRIKLKNSKRLYNFLACTLPCYFSKNTRWNITGCKKLDIKIEQLECIVCSDKQKAFLRKLHCGHFIHHKCLRIRIEKGRFHCKLDGRKYLLGYEALLKHELLNKKVEVEEKEDSESEEEEKEDIKSLGKRTSPTKKSLRTDKSTISCDSRCKRSVNKHSVEDRNKSVTSKLNHNPE